MKLLKINFLMALLLGSIQLFAQRTHYDNKPYVPNEFLIQTKDGANVRELIKRAPEHYEFQLGEYISPPMRIYMVYFNEDNVSAPAFQNWLYEQEDIVAVADYNYRIEMRSTVPTNDPDPNFNQQWHHVNTGQTGGTADADIDSDLAWDITTGGQTAYNDDIVICLIESGNLDHVDINPNRWYNQYEIENNGIDDDNNGYVDDYHGWNPVAGNDNYGTGNHGTSCLGMMGAKGDNGTLVVGANWDVKLMVVGDYSISTQANAIAAYTYPLDMRKLWNSSGGTQGAFVVATSSSWGIDGADPNNYPLWCQFYDTLGYHGILNVGATTNQNLDVDVEGDMPTACNSDYMIGVGRTDDDDNTAGGYGDQTIEFGAPGINVLTTANTNSTTITTGTSFSCPLTAGVIGLAYSLPCTDFMDIVIADPKAGADLVLQALLDGTDPKPQLSTRFITGGRLNSYNTLTELESVACTGSLCLPPNSISTSNITDDAADVNFTAYGGSDGTTMYWREVGAGTWIEIDPATSPVNLTGLTSCTEYEYYFVSTCGVETSNNSNIQTFTTTGCGACIEAGYCNSEATDGTDEWIDEVVVDTYTNTSGNDGGYGDFTGVSNIVLAKNFSYNFSVTIDWNATLYDEYTRIWIDYNQNGTFEAGEMVYDQGAEDQVATHSGSFTVPGTATEGSTRMRVQMAYIGGGQPNLPDVCDTYQWGEVEDYCVEITSDCGMTLDSAKVEEDCFGDNDGQITITATGGTPGYTYDIGSGPQGSGTFTNLSPGTYTITVEDGTACAQDITVTLAGPDEILIDNLDITGESCSGQNDGIIEVTASGGTGSLMYDAGGTPQSSNIITGVSPGSVTVTVTDDNGCTASQSGVTVGTGAGLSGTVNTTDVLCRGGNDGEIEVNMNNGTGPYLYDIGSGQQASNIFTGLMAGSYTVDVEDDNGCTGQLNATIAEPSVDLTGSATTVTEMTGFDGEINLTVNGGTAPYTYSWTGPNGFTSTSQDLTGLEGGDYQVTITDDNGCTFTTTFTVESGVGIYTNQLIDLSIYPNPTKGELNIVFASSIDATITVYSSVGQKLLEVSNFGEANLVLNLDEFSTGVYLVKISTSEGAQRIERITISR